MSTFYSQGSGNWSTTTLWDTVTTGGGTDPASANEAGMDNHSYVIQPGHVVLMDMDMYAWANGVVSLLIQSHASNPGTLVFKDGTNGCLRVKSGAVATNKVYGDATSANCRGRLLCNYSGLWTGSTASATIMASQSGVTGTVSDGGGSKRVFTPAVSPAWVIDALIGESMTINGSTYAIEDNDATTVTLTTGPAIGAAVTAWKLVVRPLSLTYSAKIMLGALATMEVRYIDGLMYGTDPTTESVRTYGQVFHEATVDATGDTLTYTGIAAALPNNTLVRVTAGSGALPAELSAGTDYWVVNASTNTIKLATSSGGSAINLSAGGPINIHCGWYANWGISANTLTKTTHGLANGTAVMLQWTGSAPTIGGETAVMGTMYYVVSTAAGSIQLAAYSGGAALTITGSPTTLHVYTGSTGAAPGIGGTNPYTSVMVNVLDDVSGDTAWVATGDTSTWATCTTRSAVCLVDAGPADYDQQRLALNAKTATTLTFNAVIDSVQYPDARVWMCSRNVAIQSDMTTGINIIDATNSTGSVWACEVRVRQGVSVSATTFYGYGLNAGSWHVATTISGCHSGLNNGTGHVATTINGCTYGIYAGSGHVATTISGCIHGIYAGSGHVATTISGCSNGIYAGAGHVATTISGCSNGLNAGSGHVATTISGCSSGINNGTGHVATTINGCTYGIYAGAGYVATTISGCGYGLRFVQRVCLPGCVFTSNGTDAQLTTVENGPYALNSNLNHNGTAFDCRSWTMGGAMTHDTDSIFVAASGKTYSHKFTHTSASYWSCMEWDIDVGTVAALSIPCYAKHDATGLSALQRLTFDLFVDSPTGDPIYGGTALDTWTADDSTSVQTHTLTYTRTDDRKLKLRVSAYRGSGNSWCLFDHPLTASGDFPDVGNVTEDDTVNGVQGTYHEATTAEVQSGVTFGASSSLTGTYTGGTGSGGGPLVGPSALISA